MKSSVLLILLSLLSLASCKEKSEQFAELDGNSEELIIENKKRDSLTHRIIFNDGDTLEILANSYRNENTDSIVIEKKTFEGRYYFCGKSPLNKILFTDLKETNKKIYHDLMDINTAHNIITKSNDTLYFSGLNTVECLSEKSKLDIEAEIFKLYYGGNHINLLIIKQFTSLE